MATKAADYRRTGVPLGYNSKTGKMLLQNKPLGEL